MLYKCKHWLLARHLDAYIVPLGCDIVHIGKFIEVHDAIQYIRTRTAGCNINVGTVNIVMHRYCYKRHGLILSKVSIEYALLPSLLWPLSSYRLFSGKRPANCIVSN
jgi:hypothetical protein